MKLQILLLLAVIAAAVIVPMASARQEKPAKTKSAHPADHDPKDIMARWMESCALNEHHARLNVLVGTWDVESSMPLHGGGKKVKGTATIRWLVEGRWLMHEQEDTLMGMPTRTIGITGYDNFKLKYVSSWVNSMTNTLLTAEGAFDKDRQNLLQFGLMDEPGTGEHDKTVRYVTRFLGPDKFAFEIHDLAIGEGNTSVMEHVYTRRK